MEIIRENSYGNRKARCLANFFQFNYDSFRDGIGNDKSTSRKALKEHSVSNVSDNIVYDEILQQAIQLYEQANNPAEFSELYDIKTKIANWQYNQQYWSGKLKNFIDDLISGQTIKKLKQQEQTLEEIVVQKRKRLYRKSARLFLKCSAGSYRYTRQCKHYCQQIKLRYPGYLSLEI